MPRLLFRPVFEYVKKKFTPTGQLSKTRSLFEACRLLNPNRINHIDRSNITSLLKRLPSIAKLPNDQCLQLFQGLQAELSTYEALARDCDGSRPIGEWWRANKLQLPTWFSVAKIVALYRPSSAAVEPVSFPFTSICSTMNKLLHSLITREPRSWFASTISNAPSCEMEQPPDHTDQYVTVRVRTDTAIIS